MTDIRVMLAIGTLVYQEGLSLLLSKREGVSLAGTAADPASAVGRALELQPDIVLMDTAFPKSLELVRSLIAAAPCSHVVALALAETETTVLAYAEAGVAGYVTPDGTVEQLMATIRSAAAGELLCSPRVAGALLRKVAFGAPSPQLPEVLTRREREIGELIGQDLSNKAIAVRLHIEVSTVKNHVHSILEKLHVSHRRHIARRVRLGARVEI